MTQPRLAICIPTHHGRAAFLRECLQSVLSQLGEVPPGSVTLSVSDNASEDGTEAFLEALGRQYPGLLTCHRHPIDRGFVPNMLQVMHQAAGEYGWLLSSDDRVAPGGLRRVYEALGSEPELAGLTVNFSIYDVSMTRRLPSLPTVLYPDGWERRRLYLSREDALRECGSLAGYVSGQVYHRGLWLEAAEALGEARLAAAGYFPYVRLLGEMLKRQPRWLWLPEPCVENRMGNDSVTAGMNRNILRYQCNVLRDITAVWAEALGPRSPAFRALIKDNYAAVWNWRSVCSYKVASRCPLSDDIRALALWTRHLSFLPGFWLTLFPVLLVPAPVLRAVALPAARRLGLAVSKLAGESFAGESFAGESAGDAAAEGSA